MKKNKKILIILIIISILLITSGITLLIITKINGPKTSLTSEDFKKEVKKHNLKPKKVEIKGENGQTNKNIKEAIYATSKRGWVIEYYVVKDEKTAKRMFKETTQIFKTFKNDMVEEENKQNQNYEIYSLSTQTYYYHVCRIDNTLISINYDDKYEKQIKKVVKELGY